jgi:hypothetical protein
MKITFATHRVFRNERKSEDSDKISDKCTVTFNGGNSVLILFVISLITAPKLCYGYVDPGAGHLIWQTAVSGLFGMVFFIRKFFLGLKDRANKPVRSENAK